jgi:hypothetical protein
MRHKAPPPLNAKVEVITDGYQLCARCGRPLLNGEPSIVAERSTTWRIYTHPEGPSCPPKAVKGWLAVRRAEGIRASPNVATYRRAEPIELNGSVRESICILDQKHIDAELELVEYESRELIGITARSIPYDAEDDLIAKIDAARAVPTDRAAPHSSSVPTSAQRSQRCAHRKLRNQHFRTDCHKWGRLPQRPTEEEKKDNEQCNRKTL